MKPTLISQTGTGVKTIEVNWRQNSFRASFATSVTGSATYSITYTLEDTSGYSSLSDWQNNANWIEDSNVSLSSLTEGVAHAVTAPITGIKLEVTAGAGTVALSWLQA